MPQHDDHLVARERDLESHGRVTGLSGELKQPAHHHDCSNLFGCGDEKGIGVLREDFKDAAGAPGSRAARPLPAHSAARQHVPGRSVRCWSMVRKTGRRD